MIKDRIWGKTEWIYIWKCSQSYSMCRTWFPCASTHVYPCCLWPTSSTIALVTMPHEYAASLAANLEWALHAGYFWDRPTTRNHKCWHPVIEEALQLGHLIQFILLERHDLCVQTLMVKWPKVPSCSSCSITLQSVSGTVSGTVPLSIQIPGIVYHWLHVTEYSRQHSL